MRRSFRDAIIGISLLGGAVIFSGVTLWLRGIMISSNYWTFNASFKDASGMSEGSPVTYRGIQIGSVKNISFTSKEVLAKIRVNQSNIQLFKPIYAKVTTSSVLGGDVTIALKTQGKFNKDITYLPKQQECDNRYILCSGDVITGKDLKNISSLTEEISDLLNQADGEEVISKVTGSIEQFDKTQENLDELISLSKEELKRARPIIEELTESVRHINNIVASIDDPSTLNDMKLAISSIRSITANLEKLSETISAMLEDEELTNSLKDAVVGIGNLFNDIYK